RVGSAAGLPLAGVPATPAGAAGVAPVLGGWPLARSWAALRPGTPDRLPYLGPVPGWEGLYAATGHGRKGLILAPVTAELLARLILDRDLDPRLAPCLPGRAGAVAVGG